MRATTRVAAWVALALAIASGALADRAPGPEWLGSVWRWGYHDIGPEYFMTPGSARTVASCMKRAGAAGLVVRIANESGACWKTQYEGRTAQWGDRDIVAELCAACRAERLKFLGYIYALMDKPLWDAHLDWRMLNGAGQPVGAVCCNSPYREIMKKRLVELAKNYPDLHGAFFDMFMWWGGTCYCQYCREKFKALSGQDPPVKEDFADPLWRRWGRFQHDSIADALGEWREAVRAARPDFVLLANTFNGWILPTSGQNLSPVRVADVLDGCIEETGWYWGAGGGWFFGWPERWPFMNLYLRSMGDNAAGPGRAIACMWEAGNIPPYLNAPLPTEEVVIRAATMISYGVHPWPYFRRGPDGMKPIFDLIAAREKWLTGAKLAPWCALVVSERTLYWYAKDQPMQRYFQNLYGVMRALLERHIPVEIITDEDLERRDLSPYAVVLAENTACLSDTAAGRLREYVRGGGGLVATYETSLYDEGGQKRADFALGDLLGVKFVAAAQVPAYVAAADKQMVLSAATLKALQGNVEDITGKPAGGMPFPAPVVLTEARSAADAAMGLWCTKTDGKPGQGPAMVASQVGRGKVIYMPLNVGKAAFMVNFEYLDRLLVDALRWAAREAPPVEVRAPRIVIAVPHRQGRRLIVHLLNDLSAMPRSQNVVEWSVALRHEVLPVRGIEVTFRGTGFKRFSLEPGGTALTARREAGGVTVTVPELGLHAMVVAEP